MHNLAKHNHDIEHDGFAIFEDIYATDEVKKLIEIIEQADGSSASFRKTTDLFAIRRFLKEVPAVRAVLFNNRLKALIKQLFWDDYFVVKSIYFDKPEKSNWFVAWHQDLTIAVDKRTEIPGYGPWTVKAEQFAVQPPLHILQNNFTVRIHLDDTSEGNGALKVIPGSHLKGIYRVENIDWNLEIEKLCNVKAGGIMIMRPLLMHASNRSTNEKTRRVVHIEFSNSILPDGIEWAEKEMI